MLDLLDFRDPLKLGKLLWPNVNFYREQRRIIYSVWENDETIAVAGNELGKDFVAAFIVLAFFLTRHPCRVVTTSVDGSQLQGVLWGEMRRFIANARFPLNVEQGGPLHVQHMRIRKVYDSVECGVSYILGRVAAKGEGLQGHHVSPMDVGMANDGVPRTLAVGDEASALDNEDYRMLVTWAKRRLFTGNPWPCASFFKYAVKGRPGSKDRGGDIERLNGGGYSRRVIRIKATDSPNVRFGLLQQQLGIKPTNEVLVPGVKQYFDYLQNRHDWDEVQQCVCLDADFWEGLDVSMFPADWLNFAEQLAESRGPALADRWMGVDSAEGGANTAWVIGDRKGVLHVESRKTPNTRDVPKLTKVFFNEWGVPPEHTQFDLGGGGKEHVDSLREEGYDVQAVGFGSHVIGQLKDYRADLEQRAEERELHYTYKSRRAQMYWQARNLLNVGSSTFEGYALPRRFNAVREQLQVIPLVYDSEGRRSMLPKYRPPNSNGTCLVDIIGHSPDEADAFVVMVDCMLTEVYAPTAGAA